MTAPSAANPHRVLAALRAEERRQLVHLLDLRRQAFLDVHDALDALVGAPTPTHILERAPGELGRRLALSSVLMSVIRDGALTDFRVWQAGPPETTTAWSDLTIRLEYPLVEAEILNGGAASFVRVNNSPQRVSSGLRERLGWTAYASAAVPVNGRPRWMVHAEPIAADIRGADLHTEAVRDFSSGLGRIIEIVSLRGVLRSFRQEQLRTARAVVERIEATTVAASAQAADEGPPDRDSLTAREQQVLGLLTKGLTTRAVAEQLLISEGTVKYHVANVLRKLGASSRADAVARYMREQARGGGG